MSRVSEQDEENENLLLDEIILSEHSNKSQVSNNPQEMFPDVNLPELLRKLHAAPLPSPEAAAKETPCDPTQETLKESTKVEITKKEPKKEEATNEPDKVPEPTQEIPSEYSAQEVQNGLNGLNGQNSQNDPNSQNEDNSQNSKSITSEESTVKLEKEHHEEISVKLDLQEKLYILAESKKTSIQAVASRFNISPTTIFEWTLELEKQGGKGIAPTIINGSLLEQMKRHIHQKLKEGMHRLEVMKTYGVNLPYINKIITKYGKVCERRGKTPNIGIKNNPPPEEELPSYRYEEGNCSLCGGAGDECFTY